ncbi:Gag polyprotein [Plecturocebus cupreus]
MPLREQRYMGEDKDSHMVERRVFTYLPFTSADLINWKNNNPFYIEKPQVLIDLPKTIVWTHNPIWADCHQLLMHLFNTDERRKILQAASNWLEEHVPADYQNPQEYVRVQLPETDPQWDPDTLESMQRLIWYRGALLG